MQLRSAQGHLKAQWINGKVRIMCWLSQYAIQLIDEFVEIRIEIFGHQVYLHHIAYGMKDLMAKSRLLHAKINLFTE